MFGLIVTTTAFTKLGRGLTRGDCSECVSFIADREIIRGIKIRCIYMRLLLRHLSLLEFDRLLL